jgi:hypothetical protein
MTWRETHLSVSACLCFARFQNRSTLHHHHKPVTRSVGRRGVTLLLLFNSLILMKMSKTWSNSFVLLSLFLSPFSCNSETCLTTSNIHHYHLMAPFPSLQFILRSYEAKTGQLIHVVLNLSICISLLFVYSSLHDGLCYVSRLGHILKLLHLTLYSNTPKFILKANYLLHLFTDLPLWLDPCNKWKEYLFTQM